MNEQAIEFLIQKIYTKDLSFETPNTPKIFIMPWEPEVSLNIHSDSKEVDENIVEVVLRLTVTVKSNDVVAYIIEVQQAGIFTVKNIPKEQKGHLFGSTCPTIIYPYAREVISDVVMRGGFPQLVLAPMNFDAMYAQQIEQQDQVASTKETIH